MQTIDKWSHPSENMDVTVNKTPEGLYQIVLAKTCGIYHITLAVTVSVTAWGDTGIVSMHANVEGENALPAEVLTYIPLVILECGQLAGKTEDHLANEAIEFLFHAVRY